MNSVNEQKEKIEQYAINESLKKGQEWYDNSNYDSIAVMAVDIDNFKLYNSIFGRDAGDILINTVYEGAKKYSNEVGGITGYLGADNFISLIPTKEERADIVEERINNILNNLDIPNGFKPSIGICITNNKELKIDILYERAQLALSQIKNKYSDHVSFYDKTSYQKSHDEQLLLIEIEKALRNNEFTFRLQPQVLIKNGKVCSFEALARWYKNGEYISPAYFIEVMEKTGYVHALDSIIWEEVCKYQRELINHGMKPLPISVNVSRADFYFMDVTKTIISLLKKYDLDPSLLHVEVTESAYMQDEGIIKKCADDLHNHGVKVLMDDFGIGFSSLSSFNNIDVDILKLDKSFIDNVANEEASRNLVETVIRMTRLTGIQVVAEGVETIEQVNFLNNQKCQFAQGYYFYKDISKEDAIKLLRTNSVTYEDDEEDIQLVEDIHFDELISEKIIGVDQLNSLIGPLCIIALNNNNAKIIQFNKTWKKLFKLDTMDDMSHMEMINTLESRLYDRINEFKLADKNLIKGSEYKTTYFLDGINYNFTGKLFSLKESREGKLYLLHLNIENQ